jgi:hypothetical protein
VISKESFAIIRQQSRTAMMRFPRNMPGKERPIRRRSSAGCAVPGVGSDGPREYVRMRSLSPLRPLSNAGVSLASYAQVTSVRRLTTSAVYSTGTPCCGPHLSVAQDARHADG